MVIKKHGSKVKILRGVDLIRPIESGMNKAPKGERTKNKIKKGIPKYNF